MSTGWVFFAAAAAALSLEGCNGSAPMACTDLFASYAVTVVDAARAPVNGATVSAVVVRTGETLQPQGLGLNTEGTYTLVDDGSIGALRASGDQVRASISRAPLATTADYVFSVPGGCHVSKVSGPDTVTLQ